MSVPDPSVKIPVPGQKESVKGISDVQGHRKHLSFRAVDELVKGQVMK